MRDITTAVDLVRKQEHAPLRNRGPTDETLDQVHCVPVVVAEENLPEKHRTAFRHAAEARPEGRARVGHQGVAAEALGRPPPARRAALLHALVWVGAAVPPGPIRRVAATLKRHQDGVLRFVSIPSPMASPKDSQQIMSIKRKACGFRNPDHFATAIYFHCGGLDLYPR